MTTAGLSHSNRPAGAVVVPRSLFGMSHKSVSPEWKRAMFELGDEPPDVLP